MCGIIGLISKSKKVGLPIFEELLKQSQIRGKHSTGVSTIVDGAIETIALPIPADRFTSEYEIPWSERMIGHVRYSTSFIKHHQPISTDEIAITHNGIITQEKPEMWEEHFGYTDFKTKNDSELLLKCIEQGSGVFKKFKKSSIACGVLDTENLYCFRNSTRPLWLFIGEQFAGFASTRNIIERTMENLGHKVKIIPTEPFTFYFFEEKENGEYGVSSEVSSIKHTEDKQIKTKSQEKYAV